MTKSIPLILKATLHATKAHRKQMRKHTDFPYIVHPLQVAQILAEETNYRVTPKIIAAAILHDVVEDTEENIDSFPQQVQRIVHLVSDPKESDSDKKDPAHRLAAIQRIRKNPDAIMVKMADRYSNLTEENDFSAKYRGKPDVQESTRNLLAVAKKAKLNKTDLYQKLSRLIPSGS